MKLSTKNMILVSLFTALTAISAFLSLPIGPVPISLQTTVVLLSSILLGGKLASLSQIIYVSLGLLGMKIFAGFNGGLQRIFSPTFGFLLGFIVSSLVVGIIIHKYKKITLLNTFITCLFGSIIIYLIGLPYMYLILIKVMNTPITFWETFKTGCLIFIPGDILKSFIASFVGLKVKSRLDMANV